MYSSSSQLFTFICLEYYQKETTDPPFKRKEKKNDKKKRFYEKAVDFSWRFYDVYLWYNIAHFCDFVERQCVHQTRCMGKMDSPL